MGSIAVTTGSVRVRTCAQVGAILKDLGRLTEGMDERQVSGHRRGRGVLEVEIYISGHTSASHASEIDERIGELGPYAVKAGRFDTEWECEKDHFFVGTDEQVAAAYKKKYLEKSGGVCPFCESSGLFSGPIQADGPVAWAAVACEDCGASWQDVWALTDMEKAKDRKGRRSEKLTGMASADTAEPQGLGLR